MRAPLDWSEPKQKRAPESNLQSYIALSLDGQNSYLGFHLDTTRAPNALSNGEDVNIGGGCASRASNGALVLLLFGRVEFDFRVRHLYGDRH
jgi:hypothetical protein